MTRRLAVSSLVVVALVAAGIAIALVLILRDGDGPDPELEDYFREVEGLVNTIDSRAAGEPVQSPSEVLPRFASVLAETADGLQGLTPPPQAQEPHDRLVVAMSDGAVVLTQLAEEHPEVASIPEAGRLRDQDPDVMEADGRARAACRDLQEVAEENGVAVAFELC